MGSDFEKLRILTLTGPRADSASMGKLSPYMGAQAFRRAWHAAALGTPDA